MSGAGNIARRSFLVGSAAVTGGVVFGVHANRRAAADPFFNFLTTPVDWKQLAQQVDSELYIHLNQSGVTIITPRADVGQGAYSVLAALVAEELDLDWQHVKVEPGEPSGLAWEDVKVIPGETKRKYYNRKVLEESTRFALVNDGLQPLAGVADFASEWVAKNLGLQMTGGSSTVADAFDKVRMAGAIAREALLLAAFTEWEKLGVVKADLRTDKDMGCVTGPNNLKAKYASLAQAAAAQAAAAQDAAKRGEVKPKDPSQWRYLGKARDATNAIPRIDMVAKCTGTATYGIDVRNKTIDIDIKEKSEPMVYATVRTNPRGGALMNYDAIKAAAQASKGVLELVKIKRGADVVGFGVIANNTWRAFRAARHIPEDPRSIPEPEWGPALYPETTEKMFEKVAESFHGSPNSTTVKNKNTSKNVDAALAAAGDGVINQEYRVPYLAHAPLEPMNAVVRFKDGQLDIWTGTQIPMWLKNNAARTAKIDTENVTLHSQYSGGSFGRRLEDEYVQQAVQLAKEYQNVPIKMTWTREEDMTHDFPRPLAIAQMKGVIKDRQVDTYDIQIASPSVTSSQLGRQKENLSLPVSPPLFVSDAIEHLLDISRLAPDVFIVAGAYDQPYQIPNYRVRGYRAEEMVPVSSWRSVGASGNAFFHECFLDELILEARVDPLEERLRLCPKDSPTWKVLDAVGKMSSWGTNLGPNRGRGLAFTLSFGVPVAEVVEVTTTDDGIKIDKVFVAVDAGRVLDPDNFKNQIEGAVIWGLGHAINAELTYKDGMPEQTNYHAFEGMRFYQAPVIECGWPEPSDSDISGMGNPGFPIRGMGEPAVPPAAPALANAIFAATGERIRGLPLKNYEPPKGHKPIKFV